MTKQQALAGIAAVLAPKRATKIAADIALSITDPRGYLAAHAKRMAERSVDEPFRELPWLALVEGLEAAKRLVEIDWKTSGVDLAWSLEKIVPKAAVKWLRAVDEIEDERATLELLEEAGQRLRAGGVQLAHLDLGSDSFCLVAAPPDAIARCTQLAKSAKLGAIEAFTGKGLAAAKRERVARQARDAREQAREVKRAAKAAEAWRFFVAGKATRTLRQSPLAVDTGHEAPGVKYYVNHYYSTAARCRTGAKDLLAAWKREGFREIDRAAHDALPHPAGAYIGWIGPFPEDGRYWQEGPRVVRCLAVVGDALLTTAGTVGRGFAELQNLRHCASPADAARELATAAQHHDANPGFFKPLSRAAAMKKWRRR